MTMEYDPAGIARAVIDANSYLTIATADRAGQPWPSPVWYAHADAVSELFVIDGFDQRIRVEIG